MLPLFKRLLYNRSGVTLAEVVVSLALVMIVSTTAISLLISSVRADSIHLDQYRAIMGCESAERCVSFAIGDADLLRESLRRIGFEEVSDCELVLANGEYLVTVALEDENYVIRYNGNCVYTIKW